MTYRRSSFLAAAGVAALLFGSSAFAGTSTTVQVSGTIIPICQFVTTNYVMSFGDLDPSSTSPATQTTTIAYECTNGTPASSIQVNGAASPTRVFLQSNNNPTNLPATLTWVTPTKAGSGFGPTVVPITFNINGTVAVADLNGASASTYVATFPITLLP